MLQASGPMYNAMILPYAAGPMALSGITWYQVRAVPFRSFVMQTGCPIVFFRVAVGETVTLLHPPLYLVGVSIVMERESVSKMTVSSTAIFRARRTPRAPPAPRSTGESWPTAAIPMDNPCCSCELTLPAPWPAASSPR